MLINLSITNYAIIDHLDIDFDKGFSVITGETGAGKSIILGALMMILGERCDTKIINHTDKKSIIEATFSMQDYNLQSFFEENDWEYDSMQCILRREILPNGRSRAFINDSPVSLSQMKMLASKMIDIHSQNNNLNLGDSSYQLAVIDGLANNEDLRSRYISSYKDYLSLHEEISNMKMRVAAAKADEDYNKFMLSQFNNLNLKEGEDEDLEEISKKLSNVSEIKNLLWSISENLEGENFSIISSLKNINHNLNSLSPWLKEASSLNERIESILIDIKDINSTVNDLVSNIEDDPSELERVNERLNNIYNLKKKHNVSTLNELLQIQSQLELKIDAIDNGKFEIEQLEKKFVSKEKELTEIAKALTESRKKASNAFETELKQLAKPLGMANIQCRIDLQDGPFNKLGKDKIQFLISFNKNQPLLPIGATASGGEISRIMLCVKTIIANKIKLPTVIFDEIDTGVSGEIANKMGDMMSVIAKEMQVVTITHLPQVAALGDNHFKVYKKDVKDSTITNVIKLSIDDRITEIAGMLGGNSVDEAAINNAKSLLNIPSK